MTRLQLMARMKGNKRVEREARHESSIDVKDLRDYTELPSHNDR